MKKLIDRYEDKDYIYELWKIQEVHDGEEYGWRVSEIPKDTGVGTCGIYPAHYYDSAFNDYLIRKNSEDALLTDFIKYNIRWSNIRWSNIRCL